METLIAGVGAAAVLAAAELVIRARRFEAILPRLRTQARRPRAASRAAANGTARGLRASRQSG